jgi:hypothetical protein
MATAFLTPTYFARPSVTKSTDEQLSSDMIRHFRTETVNVTLSDVGESGQNTSLVHSKPNEGIPEPKISDSALEDTVVVPTLRYTSSHKVSPIPEQSDAKAEFTPITYPPPPVPADSPRTEITAVQAKEFRHRSRAHFAALCGCAFLAGWNDGSPGPLLPAIQQAYNVPPFRSIANYFVSKVTMIFRSGSPLFLCSLCSAVW